jgi:4a-hydroxytetrahydrobiopterin dehydratase
MPDLDRPLSRAEASAAVGELGWRLVLGTLTAYVRAESLARATEIAARVVAHAGAGADGRVSLDVRADRVSVTVRAPEYGPLTGREVGIAGRISAGLGELGLATEPGLAGAAPRSVQAIEIGIDALDIPLVRPFWRAVLGYVDDGSNGLVDPVGQGPAVWFQQMDARRPQRNRLHFDVSVPHDEAARRIEQTLAAGGILLSDAAAPAFWVLADAEGNEACVTTWEGRD